MARMGWFLRENRIRLPRVRFGGTFHPSILNELAALGYLNKGDLAQGMHRRYYTITDPNKYEKLVLDLQMPAVDWGT